MTFAVGQTYAMRWPKYPHLLETTIVELRQGYIVAETVHRCTLGCYLQLYRKTLPIHGRQRYEYDVFAKMFQPLNPDAIALSGDL